MNLQMSTTQNVQLYIVRLYDGFDREWIDVSKPLPKDKALAVWNKYTKNGTEKTKYEHIDYYRIFEAETKMIFGGSYEKQRTN